MQEDLTDNPYENLSDSDHVTIRIRSIAQLIAGSVAQYIHPEDELKMIQLMYQTWEEFVPVVKNALWELDKLDMEDSGGLQ